MSFTPIDFENVVETKPVPAGRYDLQITQAELTQTGPNSKNPGSPQFKVSIGVLGAEGAPNIQHYVSIPTDPSETFKALLLKRFLMLFKVPFQPNGIDLEKTAMEMVGCTANAEVQLTEPNDNGDVYNRLVVPKVRDEPQQSSARRR